MSAGWFDNASCPLSSFNMSTNTDHLPQFQKQKQSTVSDDSTLHHSHNTTTKLTSSLPSFRHNNNSNSFRRALSSADMSSLHYNGFRQPSLKRVKSSLQLQSHNHDDDDHDHNNKAPAIDQVWSSIQADNNKSWGCILSAPKNNGSGSDSGQLPPPYVHPLEKRTASSLSEKSLGICTESLGSETGSDGFSCPPSDSEDEQEQEQEEDQEEQESEVRGYNYNVEVGIYKYNYNYNNNRGPTATSKIRSMMVPPPVTHVTPSFPPPLPSLAHRHDGSNLHIRSHRQDGRLLVQAVQVPSHNRFRAQRQDGRLLLTLSSLHHQDDDSNDVNVDRQEEEEEEEESADMVEKDDPEGDENELLAIPREKLGVINVQRSCAALAMTKFMELTNPRNNSTWPRNYNTTVIKPLNNNNEEVEEEAEDDEQSRGSSMTQSLPPQPTMSTATAAAVAMNAYEYYWRRSNSSAVAMLKPLVGAQNNNLCCAPQVGKDTERNNNKALFAAHNKKGRALAQQQEVVVVKAARKRAGGGASTGEKAEYVVPLMLRGCKEPKKPSLLLCEPYCIATS